MSKFTPGPWISRYMEGMSHTGDDEYWIGPDEFTSIASVRHGARDPEYGGGETLRANARLIAAAPEMLEALKGALVLLECMVEGNPAAEYCECLSCITCRRISNAIAKAEGKKS